MPEQFSFFIIQCLEECVIYFFAVLPKEFYMFSCLFKADDGQTFYINHFDPLISLVNTHPFMHRDLFCDKMYEWYFFRIKNLLCNKFFNAIEGLGR